MIIEVKSLLLILGIVGCILGLTLLWELVLLVKKLRQSLTSMDQTLETYQSLAVKTAETLGEVDVILMDTQEMADDYRAVKNEMFSLGAKAGEVATQVVSRFFK